MEMDRLTQMQLTLDSIVMVIYSTINFATDKSQFKQVNQEFDITHSNPNQLNENELHSAIFELTTDLIKQSNQFKVLVDHLPTTTNHTTENNNQDYITTTNTSSKLLNHISNFLNESV